MENNAKKIKISGLRSRYTPEKVPVTVGLKPELKEYIANEIKRLNLDNGEAYIRWYAKKELKERSKVDRGSKSRIEHILNYGDNKGDGILSEWLRNEEPVKALAYWVSTHGILHSDNPEKLAMGLSELYGKKIDLGHLADYAGKLDEVRMKLEEKGYHEALNFGDDMRKLYREDLKKSAEDVKKTAYRIARIKGEKNPADHYITNGHWMDHRSSTYAQ